MHASKYPTETATLGTVGSGGPLFLGGMVPGGGAKPKIPPQAGKQLDPEAGRSPGRGAILGALAEEASHLSPSNCFIHSRSIAAVKDSPISVLNIA